MSDSDTHHPRGVVLVVDDDLPSLRTLSALLVEEGYEVRGAPDGPTALMIVNNDPPDLVLLDVRMGGMDGYTVCRRLKENEKHRDIPVLFLSALDEAPDKVKGLAVGAVDFITKPFQAEEVLARVDTHLTLSTLRRDLERQVAERTSELAAANEDLLNSLAENERLRERLEEENIYLRQESTTTGPHEGVIGESPAFQAVLAEAEKVAPTDATVLLQGETGAGKDVLAELIHKNSPRSGRLLVRVNCAALPSTLVESELFGREKGAYTGALSRYTGRFELADGATIFLDEVSELPLELQAKLLRVLQDGEFERLGSNRTLKVDVRVLAASNRDLAKAVQEGKFREDLFYRINVFPITVPPLRERREDIPLLVWAFVKELTQKLGKKIGSIPRKTMDELQSYPWPGNIRELRNVVERSMIITQGPTLQVQLPRAAPAAAADLTMDEMQRHHIRAVLKQTGGRMWGEHGAAEILGMKPTTLESRMKKLGIESPRRRSR